MEDPFQGLDKARVLWLRFHRLIQSCERFHAREQSAGLYFHELVWHITAADLGAIFLVDLSTGTSHRRGPQLLVIHRRHA